jgi:hypothetical protein
MYKHSLGGVFSCVNDGTTVKMTGGKALRPRYSAQPNIGAFWLCSRFSSGAGWSGDIMPELALPRPLGVRCTGLAWGRGERRRDRWAGLLLPRRPSGCTRSGGFFHLDYIRMAIMSCCRRIRGIIITAKRTKALFGQKKIYSQ